MILVVSSPTDDHVRAILKPVTAGSVSLVINEYATGGYHEILKRRARIAKPAAGKTAEHAAV